MRLAIIGAQHGHVLGITRQLAAQPGVRLVAVAEPEAEARERAAAAFGVPGVADYRALLDDGAVDAAALAPVNSAKGEMAAACLDAGVHVLLDKPAVTTHHDLDRLEAAAQGSAALSCALTLRFDGPYLAAKRAIEAGEIGRVVSSASQRPHKCGPQQRPAWFFDRAHNGGALLDLCIHDIDAVRWLHGCEPLGVAAQDGAVRFTDHPTFTDHASAWFRLADGGAAFVRASWLTPDDAPYHGDCRMVIEGARGSIEIRTTAAASCTIDTGGARRTLTDFEGPSLDTPTADAPGGLARDFIAAARGETDLAVTARDVIASHRWALLARDAADSGRLLGAADVPSAKRGGP